MCFHRAISCFSSGHAASMVKGIVGYSQARLRSCQGANAWTYPRLTRLTVTYRKIQVDDGANPGAPGAPGTSRPETQILRLERSQQIMVGQCGYQLMLTAKRVKGLSNVVQCWCLMFLFRIGWID